LALCTTSRDSRGCFDLQKVPVFLFSTVAADEYCARLRSKMLRLEPLRLGPSQLSSRCGLARFIAGRLPRHHFARRTKPSDLKDAWAQGPQARLELWQLEVELSSSGAEESSTLARCELSTPQPSPQLYHKPTRRNPEASNCRSVIGEWRCRSWRLHNLISIL
jgi:hypothetical protein